MQLSIHARAHVASHARLQDAAGQHGQTQTRPDTSFGVGARTNARALRAHSCPLTYSLAHTPRCTLGSGGSPDRRGSRRGSISLSGPCDEQRGGQARMARRHVTARCSLAHTSQASSCTFHSQEAPRAQSAAVPRTGTRGSMPERRRACWPQESRRKSRNSPRNKKRNKEGPGGTFLQRGTEFEPRNLTERTQRYRVVNLLIPEEISTPCTPCTPREPVHVKVGFGLRESQFMSRGSSLSPIALSIIIRRDNNGTRNGSVYSTINRISSRI